MADFTLQDLTGEQYDEVELIVGQPLDQPGYSNVKLLRAVGYVRTKEHQPDLKHSEYNKRPIAQQIADSGLNKDTQETDEGKASNG
ncbi:hypothetical protein [Rhodococcus ruber]|uniref:hypothetical protein n=1 Tax=Rhodococcus ruber TaxID=1830 RepID=UPI003D81ABF9